MNGKKTSERVYKKTNLFMHAPIITLNGEKSLSFFEQSHVFDSSPLHSLSPEKKKVARFILFLSLTAEMCIHAWWNRRCLTNWEKAKKNLRRKRSFVGPRRTAFFLSAGLWIGWEVLLYLRMNNSTVPFLGLLADFLPTYSLMLLCTKRRTSAEFRDKS